ncbi:50S ribosomal protein L4, partial [Candidatus Fermentibacteria bacterium]
MKLTIRDTANKEKGSITAPSQFAEPYRPDLIIRAVLSLKSRARQPYGAKPGAGMRPSAELSRRRRKYRGSYGFGISRVPRKIHSRRGPRMYWVGALAPGTVGGRRAHAPKAEKKWEQKINKKENRKAIRSAMAATLDTALVKARGHKTPDTHPFIIADAFEQLKKTTDVIEAFAALGLGAELDRSYQKKIRAGKGKARGRKYKRRTGPLVVINNDEAPLIKAANNLPGVEIVTVDKLNAELLAPGTHAGRLTLYTEGALKRLADEKLFTIDFKGKTEKQEKTFVKKIKRGVK